MESDRMSNSANLESFHQIPDLLKVDPIRFRICTFSLFYQIPFYQIQSSPSNTIGTKHVYVAGALHSLNSRRLNCHKPKEVEKAVLGLWALCTPTQWYAPALSTPRNMLLMET
jgi:hypothetical protein